MLKVPSGRTVFVCLGCTVHKLLVKLTRISARVNPSVAAAYELHGAGPVCGTQIAYTSCVSMTSRIAPRLSVLTERCACERWVIATVYWVNVSAPGTRRCWWAEGRTDRSWDQIRRQFQDLKIRFKSQKPPNLHHSVSSLSVFGNLKYLIKT